MKAVLMGILIGMAVSQSANVFAGQLTSTAESRCTISAGNTEIDYGTLSRWQMQEVGEYQGVTPGKRMLSLGIICPYTHTMRVMLRGDRTVSGNLRYGDRGHLILRISNAQLDGQQVQIATTTPVGAGNMESSSVLTLQPGQSFVPMNNGKPLEGKRFTAQIEIQPIIPEDEAKVGVIRTNESRLTFELIN